MEQEIISQKKEAMYFVGIVAAEPVASAIMKIKHEFAENYNSKKPLNSPAHLTLIKPFYFKDGEIETVEKPLKGFLLAQKSFFIRLSGFGAFPPKTIFVDIEPNDKLQLLYDELCAFVVAHLKILNPYVPEKFTPHVTVGNRDLTKGNFKKAWEVFEKRKFDKTFKVDKLVLLRHNSNHWETFCELPFGIVVE
jgi:2'-5' RNA ligase